MKYFITGGTGSLGRALARRLLASGNKVLVYSRDEGKQSKMSAAENLTKVIGDIRDYDKVCVAMKRFQPDIIIHAAALKRIDDMEFSRIILNHLLLSMLRKSNTKISHQ